MIPRIFWTANFCRFVGEIKGFRATKMPVILQLQAANSDFAGTTII
jgi:hypothetical protein